MRYPLTGYSTLKKTKRLILFTVIATGVSSVTSQLVMVREFLALFSGNEFLIAMVLFNWLIAGGLGSLACIIVIKKPADPGKTTAKLGRLSLWLCALSVVQVFLVRLVRDVFFIFGSSPGFYATFVFSFFTLLPYAFLVGFALPFSLQAARAYDPDFPGGFIYITDNLGDVLGGALFSFVLVQALPPVAALSVAAIPLFAAALILTRTSLFPVTFLLIAATLSVLVAGPLFETSSLSPLSGQLVRYRETRYGRLTVIKQNHQLTVFQDGEPSVSSYDPVTAEESTHYALAQVDSPRTVLLVSARSGALDEIYKYHPSRVDYVEIDPQVTSTLTELGLIQPRPGLSVIHEDARAFLSRSHNRYDAILVHLPEPTTFQLNRFYTREWFELMAGHLESGGVLCFSVEGFDSFLDPFRQRIISSLVNTAAQAFEHILTLPGGKIYVLCSGKSLNPDIPGLLDHKKISTQYIRDFFQDDVNPMRRAYLSSALLPLAPINTDAHPRLMVLMLSSWFYKFQTSPWLFIGILSVFLLCYIPRLSRQEFLLFTTGWVTMGSELLVIFSFQIFFGFIYYQIGVIVTVFLAGLLPGAYTGTKARFSPSPFRWLRFSDSLIITLLLMFSGGIMIPALRNHILFYLIFGAMASFACGFQFPLALVSGKESPSAAGQAFGADLMGAAFGVLVTSMALIPFLGLVQSALILASLKCLSIFVFSFNTSDGRYRQP